LLPGFSGEFFLMAALKPRPATWKKIKEEIKGDENKRIAFIGQLQNSIR